MKNRYMTGMLVRYNLTADDIYSGVISKLYTANKLPKDYIVTSKESFYYEIETNFEDLGIEKVIVPESYIIGFANEIFNK